MSVEQSVNPPEVKAIIIGMFGGMLSGFQKVVFRDLKAAGFETKVAHKIAIDYGSQLGLAMKNDENIKTKVGKANSDGEARMSASFHDKLKMHDAMALYRVVQTVDGLVKEQLVNDYTIDGLNLTSRLKYYISQCEQWALAQTWKE